jgi:hypothetical protein
MGKCQRAGTCKNKVVSLKNYIFSLKLVFSRVIFVLSSHNIIELFEKSVRKKVGERLLLSSPLFKPTAPNCTPL